MNPKQAELVLIAGLMAGAWAVRESGSVRTAFAMRVITAELARGLGISAKRSLGTDDLEDLPPVAAIPGTRAKQLADARRTILGIADQLMGQVPGGRARDRVAEIRRNLAGVWNMETK